MKKQTKDGVLTFSEIGDIVKAKAGEFRDTVIASIGPDIHTIEIDLAGTRCIESDGLVALFAIYKSAQLEREGVTMRLLNSKSSLQQLFEITRLCQLYEIGRRQ